MKRANLQVAALLRLRWQMARAPGVRLVIVLIAVAVVWLLRLVVGTADTIHPIALATAIDVAPLAFLGFSFLAVIAPLTAGGGSEIVPSDQLVAYPVVPTAQFFGGLVLAPLNLVWLIQLMVLAALTSYLTFDGNLALAAVPTIAFVCFTTVAGQAVAWTVLGVRRKTVGRRLIAAAGGSLLLAGLLASHAEVGVRAPLQALTTPVVRAVSQGALGNYRPWATTTAVLLLLMAGAAALGSRACAWALRTPSDEGARRTRKVRRRAPKAGVLRELVAVNRASVWRAPALRRGGLVLVLLPGLAAASAEVPWESMIVLPGLVAAGAGLLFGVNAFSLDGSGAIWLASLPHAPKYVLYAKAVVLGETVLGAVVIAVIAGSLRSPGTPSEAQLTAIIAGALTCTALVVAGGLKISVRRPHRADLRGKRDAVAPPGALAVASARLAFPAAVVGVLMATSSQAGLWWWPPLLATPIVLLSVLSLIRTCRRYDDPFVRARIVQTVAAG